jgi:hypothetical protein
MRCWCWARSVATADGWLLRLTAVRLAELGHNHPAALTPSFRTVALCWHMAVAEVADSRTVSSELHHPVVLTVALACAPDPLAASRVPRGKGEQCKGLAPSVVSSARREPRLAKE